MQHLRLAELEAGLDQIRRSPQNRGPVELIVRRPGIGERELLDAATLDPEVGLVGDSWIWKHGSKRKPRAQLTVMNVRAAALFAVDPQRRALAGDQLYVDLDLGGENLPPGTRLSVGEAVIEVTDLPHTGCGKFVKRFGVDAQKLCNSPVGRSLSLRGINSIVITGGEVRVGDTLAKILVG
ncbi:MAG TPA: hypothetical protein VG410_09430 [Solirubrobacteraceae bacterium]|nr:hypothetical protein [Solirubrobacteraceae bacterium]